MNTEKNPQSETSNEADGPARFAASSLLDADWQPVRMMTSWYRFGRLRNRKHRTAGEVPLGFGWVFSTELTFDCLMVSEEQMGNPLLHLLVKRLVFWKLRLDPVILPVARQFARLANWIHPPLSPFSEDRFDLGKRPPETLKRSDHPLEVRSPTTGLVEWVNDHARRKLFGYVALHEKCSGVGCNDSYDVDKHLTTRISDRATQIKNQMNTEKTPQPESANEADGSARFAASGLLCVNPRPGVIAIGLLAMLLCRLAGGDFWISVSLLLFCALTQAWLVVRWYKLNHK